MSELEKYFKGKNRKADPHPLLRFLDDFSKKPEFGKVLVDIRRPRSALGFDPAVICLCFLGKDDQEIDSKDEEWDIDLNAELVKRGVRARNEENESIRFGLVFDSAFEKPETKFGDGFFSSVLVYSIKKSPFAQNQAVENVLKFISANQIPAEGVSFEHCSEMVERILQERWDDLIEHLRYPEEAAERILGGAVVNYLDERFSVTDRKKLGWA